MRYDVAVIGGGPAGCAAAITAARAGLRTVIFERGQYPRHRVCGEFISAESHHLLINLLGPTSKLLQQPATITGARMFSDGRSIEFALPEPSLSISRFDLDLALWNAAIAAGAECLEGTTVERATGNELIANGRSFSATGVINATGRWSNLRRPLSVPTPRWIGLKAHFRGEHAPASTDIYFFRGGYCGVQPVGSDVVNASAMVRSDVATTIEEVFAAHPELWRRSRGWEQCFDTISTSPLVHAKPEPLVDGVLNAGDAAGFIDPFVGDGISLALRSGALAAGCIQAPQRYAREYHRRFDKIFESASLARRLVHAPELIRRLTIISFQSKLLRNWALKRTRGN